MEFDAEHLSFIHLVSQILIQAYKDMSYRWT